MKSCGCSPTTCCHARHRALKADARLLELHTTYAGIQHDEGFEDLEYRQCRRCKSHLAVKVERRAA